MRKTFSIFVVFLVAIGLALADFSNDVLTIRNDILTLTHPEHRFMSLQGFASERKLTADEMSDRLLSAADELMGGTNATEESLCRNAIWGVGHFGSDKALARLEEYVLSGRADSGNPFSTTPLQLAALTAYERITHGDDRFKKLLAQAKSAEAICESWAASFSQDDKAIEDWKGRQRGEPKTMPSREVNSAPSSGKAKGKATPISHDDGKPPVVDKTCGYITPWLIVVLAVAVIFVLLIIVWRERSVRQRRTKKGRKK